MRFTVLQDGGIATIITQDRKNICFYVYVIENFYLPRMYRIFGEHFGTQICTFLYIPRGKSVCRILRCYS